MFIVVSNHPVHIVSGNGQILPSALIPFCEFGENMHKMGLKVPKFDIPVCNSFKAMILNDQLCYEVDLNRFSHKEEIERELKSGFAFILDYNEDRQVSINEEYSIVLKNKSLVDRSGRNVNQEALLYLNTIGIENY